MRIKSTHIVAFFVASLFTSCHNNPHKKQEAPPYGVPVKIDLDSIKRRGYLNVLIDNNSISYFIYKGQPMGYDYELLKLFAKDLGVHLKLNVTSGIGKAMQKLNAGEGDIMAFPLTITKDRKQFIAFSSPHFNSYQVLVQRKPDHWRRYTSDQIEDSLIRNPADLIGKEVVVLPQSSFVKRLENLSEEIGGDIVIEEDSADAESESLIKKVAQGEINLTVADHAIAAVNQAYYPNLDIQTIISLPQQIAWGLRQTSPELRQALNQWFDKIKREPTFMVIYNRYYKSPRTSRMRMHSDYSSLGGNKLSPYDDLIKKGAEKLGWDWRLLAAVIYQESHFQPQNESWAGAQGLMQLMPETAARFGVTDPSNPRQNIQAGVKYLRYLDKYWASSIPDQDERLKFVLASYNAGPTHIKDAQKLTKKYGGDPSIWYGNVEKFLQKKSKPEFFQDPVVQAGYCKCEEPVNYVIAVLDMYEEYKTHISAEIPLASNNEAPISQIQ